MGEMKSRGPEKQRIVVLTPVLDDGRSFARLCRKIAALRMPGIVGILAVDDGSVIEPPQLSAIVDAQV